MQAFGCMMDTGAGLYLVCVLDDQQLLLGAIHGCSLASAGPTNKGKTVYPDSPGEYFGTTGFGFSKKNEVRQRHLQLSSQCRVAAYFCVQLSARYLMCNQGLDWTDSDSDQP